MANVAKCSFTEIPAEPPGNLRLARGATCKSKASIAAIAQQ